MPSRIRFDKPHDTAALFQELRNAGVACKVEDLNSNCFWIYLEQPTPLIADVVRSVVDAHVPATVGGEGGPHTHALAEVVGLEAALAGKVDTADPRLTDTRDPNSHSHPQSDVTGLAAALAAKVASDDARLSDARTPLAHTHPQSEVTALTADLASKQATSEKGQANGYAALDAQGKVPSAQLPAPGGESLPSGVILLWHGLIESIPSGWALCDGSNNTPDLRGRFIRGAAGEAGGTGGASTHTHDDHGSLSHSGTAVADHPSHTHAYTQVPNHTHPIAINDPGHAHTQRQFPTTTGGSAGNTIDASMSGAQANQTLTTATATTGITASSSDPAGGVAQGTTNGPSATLSHQVTQPSAHAIDAHSQANHCRRSTTRYSS